MLCPYKETLSTQALLAVLLGRQVTAWKSTGKSACATETASLLRPSASLPHPGLRKRFCAAVHAE